MNAQADSAKGTRAFHHIADGDFGLATQRLGHRKNLTLRPAWSRYVPQDAGHRGRAPTLMRGRPSAEGRLTLLTLWPTCCRAYLA